MRRNASSSTLSELRRREQQQGQREASDCQKGSRKAVIEAVTYQVLTYALGKAKASEEMRAASAADAEARPPGLSASVQQYITTIVRQLELPNSCIVAALIYVERAVSSGRFALSLQNWQPSLLAAFVVAAKLAFDEPVWNEDFVKALRISNVQVSRLSFRDPPKRPFMSHPYLSVWAIPPTTAVPPHPQLRFHPVLSLSRAHPDAHLLPTCLPHPIPFAGIANLALGGRLPAAHLIQLQRRPIPVRYVRLARPEPAPGPDPVQAPPEDPQPRAPPLAPPDNTAILRLLSIADLHVAGLWQGVLPAAAVA